MLEDTAQIAQAGTLQAQKGNLDALFGERPGKPAALIVGDVSFGALTSGGASLDVEGWSPENKANLESLIGSYSGKGVAVFDMDGTLTEGNVGGVVQAYMIRELQYSYDERFWKLIPEECGRDQMRALYKDFASLPLEEAKKTQAYKEYVRLFSSVYGSIRNKEGNLAAYRWATALSVGLSEGEARAIARKVVDSEYGKKIKVHPQMRELALKMQENGWKVYIVSGSNDWVVKEMAERLGIPPERALGSKVKVRDGVLTDEVERIHYREGKTETIRKEIASEIQFAAGDGVGDMEMLQMSRHGLVLDYGIPYQGEILDAARKNGWWIQDASFSGRKKHFGSHEAMLEESLYEVEKPLSQPSISFLDIPTAVRLDRSHPGNKIEKEAAAVQYIRNFDREANSKAQQMLVRAVENFSGAKVSLRQARCQNETKTCCLYAISNWTGIAADKVIETARRLGLDPEKVQYGRIESILRRLKVRYRRVPQKSVLQTLARDRRPMLVVLKLSVLTHAAVLTPFLFHHEGESKAVLIDSNLEGPQRVLISAEDLPDLIQYDVFELLP